MKFLPRRRFVIESPLPASEIINRLQVRVEQHKSLWLSRDHQFFEGWVEGNEFGILHVPTREELISRNSAQQQTYRPRVIGQVDERPDGSSQISGTMRLRRSVAAFGTLGLGIAAIVPLAIVLSQPRDWPGLIFELALVAIGADVISAFESGAQAALTELSAIAESTKSTWL